MLNGEGCADAPAQQVGFQGAIPLSHVSCFDYTHFQVVSPNGVGFVDAATRPGVLPRMLAEILDTRIMIKGAMKNLSPSDRVRSPCAF